MKLLTATRNAHKLREIRSIFSGAGVELLGMDHVPDLPEVDEDKTTFRGNAAKKAVTLARASGLTALADDSGLEVDALSGAPGVRSARYAGEPPDYEANNRKLLRETAGAENRRARFKCALALASPDGTCRVLEGKCEGVITETPRGENGFGYDPLFIPEGYSRTFAEMEPQEKNSISHRAAALKLAREKWAELLGK
ncbi:MAG: XTP/dITP diphosphatase [Kiritimatiellia bacterium]